MEPSPAFDPPHGRSWRGDLRAFWERTPFYRSLRHRDFRLLWIGAFVSFTGSWIQNVAQGYTVEALTRDASKLAFVSFCNSIPVFVFGMIAGSLVDVWDRRKALIWCQTLFALGSFYLAAAIHLGFISYWHFPVVSLLLGLVATVEMPARQSLVSRCVPPVDLGAAVPVQALTFNAARIIGPAVAAAVLAAFGSVWCYVLNGISFLALIGSIRAIRADLSPTLRQHASPVRDLIAEGMRYTFRDVRLKTLFLLESCTAIFGIAHMALMPSFIRESFGLVPNPALPHDPAKQVLGACYTAVGVGAIIGLLMVASVRTDRGRALSIRIPMLMIGLCLLALTQVRTPWQAYPVLALLGWSTIMQFNTTNTLFQLLSPDALRGRTLAMHIWSLNGLSPFGVLFLGWIAKQAADGELSRWLAGWQIGLNGIGTAFFLGGSMMLVGATAAFLSRRGLSGLADPPLQA